MPIFIELIGDKPINKILQADINHFFDVVQNLPIKRDAKIYKGLSIIQIIAANKGRCIAEGTFDSIYRVCISLLINWVLVNYKDQGFPKISVKVAIYRGNRADGINKQRAIKPCELKTLFGHSKMKKYSENPDTVHYCWPPDRFVYRLQN